MARRDRDDAAEQLRQRLLTRRLVGIIAALSVAVTYAAVRRWWL